MPETSQPTRHAMTCDHAPTQPVHLRAGGVSLVLDSPNAHLPRILYWGEELTGITDTSLAALATMTTPSATGGTIDTPAITSIITEPSSGWPGTPGLTGSRNGQAWTTAFRVTGYDLATTDAGDLTTRWYATDTDAALTITLTITLLVTGIVRAHAAVTNAGDTPYQVDHLGIAFPFPAEATEALDFTGRWARERAPQRRPLTVGTHLREAVRGKPGHDAPYLTVVGEPHFGFRHGEVRAFHLAWSGNQRIAIDTTFSGEQVVRAGEYLHPGEIQLAPGDTYTGPAVMAVWSGTGLDGVTQRFHQQMRTRSRYPASPRPVTINVWEAVYFDHDVARLRDLAERAAALGVERYVLDDGWFGSRRDDTSGLGDWQISHEVWPGDTLPQLAQYVHDLGMQFGIWFEPEMINPDSEVARRHPEWVLAPTGRLPREARHQQVMDLTNPEAFAYVRDAMVEVIRRCNADYVKWDHNRDLLESGSQLTGRAAVHEQTLAAYRLLDELRTQFPHLEIESCSGGGARIDWEILQRTDRVWASDCIDAHERQMIQRWTSVVVPPEMMGSHVGDGRAHTTGRMHDIDYRAGTALFGHFGIEWDLARATDRDLDSLRAWIARYKELRGLLHSGVTVRSDMDGAAHGTSACHVHGVVATDGTDAVFALVSTDRPSSWPVRRVVLPGLDQQRTYTLDVLFAPTEVNEQSHRQPGWWGQHLTVQGAVLSRVGLALPDLNPDTLMLVRVTAVEGDAQ